MREGAMTRQARYQERHILAGLCTLCPSKAFGDSAMCQKHLVKRRLYKRELLGLQPWQRGKRGRPPLEATR